MTALEMANRLVVELKGVSPVAVKLMGLLDQAELDNEHLVEVLKLDAVLTAKLLRACNSPALGLAEPVASVDQAVLLMGYQQIHRMALTLVVDHSLSAPLRGYALEANELWRHSLAVACAAELLGRGQMKFSTAPAIAFTAGLLHDLGKLGMNQVLDPATQAAIRYRVAEHAESRIEAERIVLGVDHAELGACLLRLWNVPEIIAEAVAHHHEPVTEPECRLSALVCVANGAAHMAGSAPGWEAYALKIPPRVEMAFALTEQKLEALIVALHESLHRAETLIAR